MEKTAAKNRYIVKSVLPSKHHVEFISQQLGILVSVATRGSRAAKAHVIDVMIHILMELKKGVLRD